MSDKTLFEKIIAREIPADIVFEDEQCIAFRDVNPQAPMHVLVCPKKPMPMLSDAAPADKALLGHLLMTASVIAAVPPEREWNTTSSRFGSAIRRGQCSSTKFDRSNVRCSRTSPT